MGLLYVSEELKTPGRQALSRRLLLENEKELAEGAGAVPLAALLAGLLPLRSTDVTAMALSGGTIDVNLIELIIDRGLVTDGRLVRFAITVRHRSGNLATLTRIMPTRARACWTSRIAARMPTSPCATSRSCFNSRCAGVITSRRSSPSSTPTVRWCGKRRESSRIWWCEPARGRRYCAASVALAFTPLMWDAERALTGSIMSSRKKAESSARPASRDLW